MDPAKLLRDASDVVKDPSKEREVPWVYPVIASRFYSPSFPQGPFNDKVTLVALGSTKDCQIYSVTKESH